VSVNPVSFKMLPYDPAPDFTALSAIPGRRDSSTFFGNG
jgi:hypothetical protein